MTDEPAIGPLPTTGPPPAGAVDESSGDATRIRLSGSILAAILAAIAIGIAVRVDGILVADPLDSPIATVFGERGIAFGDPFGQLLVWMAGPLAAAIAGFVFAPAAARGVFGSGLWMGAATYVVAIAIAPLALVPSAIQDGIDVTRDLFSIPLLWLFAGAALGPLLAVCLIAGPIWAATVRLTLRGPVRGGAPTRTYPLLPIVILGVSVLLGWAIVMAILGAVGNATID
jgi:hypothetical protein